MFFHRPWPRPSAAAMVRLFAMGFFGVFLYNVCFFTGLRTVPAGRASLMASMQPSAVFLFSAIFWRERGSPIQILGLLLSLVGAVLVIAQGSPAKLLGQGLTSGDLWVIGCAVCWAAYTILGRGIVHHLSPLAATAYSTWLGTVMLLILSFLQPASDARAWTPAIWLAMLFLGLGGTTAAFLLFLKGIGQIGPSRASVFINLVPVFGVAFSALILGESITAPTVIGGVICITGIRLLNRRPISSDQESPVG